MPLSPEDRQFLESLTKPDPDGGRYLKQGPSFTADQPASGSSSAVSEFFSITTSDTGEVVKASAGNLYGYNVINLTAADFFLKFYNKATAPTAADTPVMIVLVPASQSVLVTPNSGILRSFSAGISVRSVTGAADADTTDPAVLPIVRIQFK